MKSRMLSAGLPILAVLALPPLAGASTQVRVDQVEGLDVVVVVDDDGAGDIRAELASDGVAVRATGGVAPGDADCTQAGADVHCLGTFDAIVAFGNGGNDTIDMKLIADGAAPLRAEISGGEGNDTLKVPPDNRDVPQPQVYIQGDNGNDTITTGNGDDELHGNGGNDTVQSFLGDDSVFGEEGDDSVSGGTTGADLVDGGPGNDSIPDGGGDYSRIFTDAVMSISLDGQPNDGEAGEGDNVVGIEKLTVRGAAVTLVGDDGPNDFLVEAGGSTVRGLGGDDRLVTHDGNDTIEGGDGNDFIEAGFGNDILDGGAGVDQFSGDRTESNVFAVGNDEIRARDGNSEQIGCGIGGGDRAIVDGNDVVSSDCEAVERPVVPPGPGPGPIPPPTPDLTPGKPKLLGKLSVKAIASKGLAVQVSCPAACAVTGQLRVDKKTARKLRLGKSRVLARGKKALQGAGTAKVTLKVVKKARKRFKRLRKAKVTLITGTTIAGKSTPASRTLTLKR